jgi:muramidase (phage lysozyme)
MIRKGEGTTGPQGYRTKFGGGTFDTSKGWNHPDQVVNSGGYSSAAAGAYQFLPGTWQGAKKALGLKSFDPNSQDLAALYLAKQRGAINALQKPGVKLVDVMDKLAPEWASIPTKGGNSYYGQPVKSASELAKAYEAGKGTPLTPAAPTTTTPVNTAVNKGNNLADLIVQKVIASRLGQQQQQQGIDPLLQGLMSYSHDAPRPQDLPDDFLGMFL